ncbi:MAG: ACT domain-containing protein [Deltaproteobacteria bacterium]|jgi:glycine cleavage system transcriptional repressor|nr:ACT domain-containing protein [Deltaproteobacteria bacterium]MBW2531736.1 ACT domain-containing protein [Deltaproteobacteria bacterium]
MSKRYLVLTAVGPDRAGLVKDVSQVVFDAGCNLEDSRMAVLAGEFAIILLLSGDTPAVAKIDEAGRARLEGELGLGVSIKPTEARSVRSEQLVRRLEVHGADRAGIVHQVTDALAKREINVASLESRLTHAPFSGMPMFRLVAELEIPNAETLSAVATELEELCEELDLTCAIEE